MRKIYKYQIPFHKNIVLKIPNGWEAISWQLQDGVPTMWAIVDTEQNVPAYEFVWLATGDQIPYSFAYQATFQEGGLVYHLFINTAFYI